MPPNAPRAERRALILALDVHYEAAASTTACVGLARWTDASTAFELVDRAESPPAPYAPGEFYRRELPQLTRILSLLPRTIDVEAIVIDAHVWLADHRPGLGARLFDALGGAIAVVGVAKSSYRGADATPVLRGASQSALFVSAAGMDAARAAEHVLAMHGPHRLPTALRRVDRLARGLESPRASA